MIKAVATITTSAMIQFSILSPEKNQGKFKITAENKFKANSEPWVNFRGKIFGQDL